MKNVAIIPARAGSERIKNKNLQKIGGKTLIELAIRRAAKLDGIILSTDYSEEQLWEAGVPEPKFMDHCYRIMSRPPHLATSDTKTIDVLLDIAGQIDADYITVLQPTSPMITADDVDRARLWLGEHNALVSVCVAHKHLRVIEYGSIVQRNVVRVTGGIYMIRVCTLLTERTLFPQECLPYFIPERKAIDIDTIEDLTYARGNYR